MDIYEPGSHVIATLHTSNNHTLLKFDDCRNIVNELVEKFSLSNLGEVYHNFSPAGFTAVICLSESHISIHTWPEHGKINLDIYLSNFRKTNDTTVQRMLDALVAFFDATITDITTLKR